MISVCLAVYNGEKYIAEQLDSILSQLSDIDEVIVSDDHSSDSTVRIIENLGDRRIRIVTNDREKGYTRNFENAISYSNGDVIFLSDQDDVWLPNKVSVFLEALSKKTLAVSNCYITDSNLKIINDSFFSFRRTKKGVASNIIRFSYLGCCMAFTKELKELIIPFPNNQKYCTHDNWIFLVAAVFCSVSYLDEKMIYYRRHSANTSFGGIKSTKTVIFMIAYRLYLIIQLFILWIHKVVFINWKKN
jgi:glycosyltransferase involved in cell wall biosynthesis